MNRFTVIEHAEKGTGRKWFSVIDNGWEGHPQQVQVGVNCESYLNAANIAREFNEEWDKFRRNPW